MLPASPARLRSIAQRMGAQVDPGATARKVREAIRKREAKLIRDHNLNRPEPPIEAGPGGE